MPVEIVLFGAVVPTLLPIFALTVILYLVADKLTSRWDLDRWVWHPALFRLALFVCLFSLLGLGGYG